MASQDAAEAVVELVQTQLEAQTQGVNCGTSHFFNQHCLSLLLSSVFWKLVFSSIPCPKFLLKFSILLVFKAIFSDQRFPTKHPPRQCLWRKQFNTDIHRKTSSRPKRGRLPTPSAWPEVLMQAHRFVAAEAWPWARGRGTWPDHDILGNPQKDRKIKSQSRISGRYFFYFLGGCYIYYISFLFPHRFSVVFRCFSATLALNRWDGHPCVLRKSSWPEKRHPRCRCWG